MCNTVLSTAILPLSQSTSKLFNFNFLFLLFMTDFFRLRRSGKVERTEGDKSN